MKESTRGVLLYVLILAMVLIALAYSSYSMSHGSVERLTDAEFRQALEDGEIDSIEITPIKVGDASMGDAAIKFRNGLVRTAYISDIEAFRQTAAADYPSIRVTVDSIKPDSVWSGVLPVFLMTLVLIVIMTFVFNRMQNGGSNAQIMNFGKSHATLASKQEPVHFSDVAGLEEEKAELFEVVDFLRNPQKYVRLGARIPKGILLVGPPGTGKTYLARSVAGEAGVPFFTISGSDFVEMFVGVGASRVRDLFEQAKKSAPSIVFIDEIDAVGRQRGAGVGGGHDEREQTLNQLLVEMDGFTTNQGVIVMAATNRVDILDPALMRPGRFDRQVVVGKPDLKGREQVLQIHSRRKPLGSDVNLHEIAQMTAGFTPADLENLMNEAAISTARENRQFITQNDIKQAFVKVGVGTEKKSHVISEREKNITAVHEAGHAIIHHVLPDLDPVYTISIIPTGLAGGYTMPIQEEDMMYLTRTRMQDEIVGLLGGRVAEEIEFGDVTTGASNDIERATKLARDMVTRYGMSDRVGLVQLGEPNEEVFLGRELGHTRNYGEDVATVIDEEIHRIVEESHDKARQILTQYHDVLLRTRDVLMAKEKISGVEFDALFAPAAASPAGPAPSAPAPAGV